MLNTLRDQLKEELRLEMQPKQQPEVKATPNKVYTPMKVGS